LQAKEFELAEKDKELEEAKNSTTEPTALESYEE
jgi:hypothetical protein